MKDKIHKLLSMLKMDRTQATIVLCGFYIFFSLTANIASTKVTYFAKWITDAGFVYYLTFTWRDLIHKQLGKKAAITTIFLAGALNLIAALFFQFVVMLPGEQEWIKAGGQTAWNFIFGLQLRIVIASVLAAVIAELSDTYTYQWWVLGIGKKMPQWTRVFVSNGISIPIDSILFPLIAFSGIYDWNGIMQIFWTNIELKALFTLLSFWLIYLVPEKPIYGGS